MIRIPAITSQNLIVSKSAPDTLPPVAREIIDDILNGCPSNAILNEEQSLRLLDAIGIARKRSLIATNIEEAKQAVIDLGLPVRMTGISMRSDDESIIVDNVTDRNTMRLEFHRMMREPDVKGVLFAPALEGTGAYFGIRHRAKRGHLVICGTYSRSQKRPLNYIACTLPVTKKEAKEMYERVKEGRLTNEVLFLDTLCRLSALCTYAPQIDKMDIHPVITTARSVVALDASVSLR